MAAPRIEPLETLVREFQRLPGIGPRSAERLTFHILRAEVRDVEALAEAILNLKRTIRHCSRCFNLTDIDPCAICTDPRRDQTRIWVVEQPRDVLAMEATGLVQGVYHVLMGHISPLEGIGPADLNIEALLQRVSTEDVEEVILATNPTMEGDGTALHLATTIESRGIKVTRLARGLAVGSKLEYATHAMLEAAIRGRR